MSGRQGEPTAEIGSHACEEGEVRFRPPQDEARWMKWTRRVVGLAACALNTGEDVHAASKRLGRTDTCACATSPAIDVFSGEKMDGIDSN